MNKKAQINPSIEQGGTGVSPSPLLIVGIFLFVVPFFNGVVGNVIPKWIGTFGVIFLVAGIIHSIFMSISK